MFSLPPSETSIREGLDYPAQIEVQSGQAVGTFLGLGLQVTGSTEAEVRVLLAEKLSEYLQDIIAEGRQLPTIPHPVPNQVEWITPKPDTFEEKASEKFLDFTKAEFERVLANTKLAEERARQNMTFALVVLPIMTFLKPTELTDWSVPALVLAALTLLLVVVVLLLGGLATKSANVDDMGWDLKQMSDERQIMWFGYRSYKDELYHLQKTWLQNTIQMNRVRSQRFELVDCQSWCLIGLASALAALLLVLMFNI